MTRHPPPDRRADALRMADMAASARRAEAISAQVIIDRFVERIREQGVAPVPLLATQLDGRTVKTDRVGWYVNRKRSFAIGEDGAWYVLTVPSSKLGWWRGVRLEASDPELVVARGARDGESGDLGEFLDRILDQGPILGP